MQIIEKIEVLYWFFFNFHTTIGLLPGFYCPGGDCKDKNPLNEHFNMQACRKKAHGETNLD